MTYTVTTNQIIMLTILAAWELVWKGIALWQAAHRGQRNWFIAILVINSAGFLPIAYLLTTRSREAAESGGYLETPIA